MADVLIRPRASANQVSSLRTDDFANRLRKRHKHLRRWAERWPTDAFRIYNWDIPEWPFAVDCYGDAVVLQHFVQRRYEDESEVRRAAAVQTVEEVLDVAPEEIFVKERKRQKGGAQYERVDDGHAWRTVSEDGLVFRVDLAAYLDTGLFLDHRELRRIVADELSSRTAPLFLNLFSYTGAFSVWGARAGATVTTVDLSNTYLDWAKTNFELNNFDPDAHRFERSDVMRWLPQEHQRGGRFDVIVLDPPTVSRSKKMVRDLDIQRDHEELIRGCRALLNDEGVLYFSNNFRDFRLAAELAADEAVTEITRDTIPKDFTSGIHRAWRIR